MAYTAISGRVPIQWKLFLMCFFFFFLLWTPRPSSMSIINRASSKGRERERERERGKRWTSSIHHSNRQHCGNPFNWNWFRLIQQGHISCSDTNPATPITVLLLPPPKNPSTKNPSPKESIPWLRFLSLSSPPPPPFLLQTPSILLMMTNIDLTRPICYKWTKLTKFTYY